MMLPFRFSILPFVMSVNQSFRTRQSVSPYLSVTFVHFVRPGSWRTWVFSPPSRYSIGSLEDVTPVHAENPPGVSPGPPTRKFMLGYGSPRPPVAMISILLVYPPH